MKILHTSDWHVGRHIRGRSRAPEHIAVLAEIAGIAGEHEVDVILIAGDMFDTATPSAESEAIVYTALLDLVATGAHVVLVSGNHDNAKRWKAIKPLLGRAEVHAGSELMRPSEGGLIELTTKGGERAKIALLPFVSQRRIVRAGDLMKMDSWEHTGLYQEKVGRIIDHLTAGFEADTVNILMAHLTVVGGTMGGGERAAHSIFDYHIPPTRFPSTAHYVALGHLHEAQQVPGPCPTWYSGSPLQLDFGEAGNAKHVLIVEATPGSPASIDKVALTSGRQLVKLRGTVEQVRAAAEPLGDAYLKVVIDEPGRAGLAEEVRDLLPHAVDVSVSQADLPVDEQVWDSDRLQGSPEELFSEYLTEQNIDDPDLQTMFHELIETVYATEEA